MLSKRRVSNQAARGSSVAQAVTVQQAIADVCVDFNLGEDSCLLSPFSSFQQTLQPHTGSICEQAFCILAVCNVGKAAIRSKE